MSRSRSIDRVIDEAVSLGLDITVTDMTESTRTAQEAADAVGCDVSQIVKSLIFEREDNGKLILALVSGAQNADLDRLAYHAGSPLRRADPRKVREVTGFAIGGVAPIGHLTPLNIFMDAALLQHETVWAAAGKPHAVFQVNPATLASAIGAKIFGMGENVLITEL